jgi:hypothetical protein
MSDSVAVWLRLAKLKSLPANRCSRVARVIWKSERTFLLCSPTDDVLRILAGSFSRPAIGCAWRKVARLIACPGGAFFREKVEPSLHARMRSLYQADNEPCCAQFACGYAGSTADRGHDFSSLLFLRFSSRLAISLRSQ